MAHVNWGRAVLAGFAANLASFVVGGGGYLLFGGMFRLEPSSIWRWTPDRLGEMSGGWWAYLILGNTALAVVVGLVYALLYDGIPGRGPRKGLAFGFVLWLVGVLPPAFTMHVMTVVNGRAVLYLSLQGLVEYLVYGALIAWIYGEPPSARVPSCSSSGAA